MTDIPLVQALERAAQEPAQRPAFYRALMKADVFVIGHTDQPDLNAHGHHTIPAGANVSLVNWEKADGTPVIPFFSHLEALQRAIDDETSYLSLPARSLFELTRGATLFLNPKSDHGKEFVPHEIEALLDTGMNQKAATRGSGERNAGDAGAASAVPHSHDGRIAAAVGWPPWCESGLPVSDA